MKIKHDDFQTLNLNYDNDEITIKFKNRETLVEFGHIIKNLFYAGPGFPNDFIDIKFFDMSNNIDTWDR